MSTDTMKVLRLTPSWKMAARIFIECLKHGDSNEAKENAEKELMQMAENLDAFIEVDNVTCGEANPTNDPWEISYCGGEYEIAFDSNRPRLSPAWHVWRKNDRAQSERYYSWPEGAFSALSWGRIKWSK